MSKAKIISRLIPIIIWLTIMSLIQMSWGIQLIWFWLGGIIGTFLLELDHVVYLLWQYPGETNSLRFKAILQQKQYRQALDFAIQTASSRSRLSFHNVLFEVIFVVFSFWVLTSSGSTFGFGLVMSLLLALVITQVQLLLSNQIEELGRIFFWPIQTEVSPENKQWFVVSMVFAVLVLSYVLF